MSSMAMSTKGDSLPIISSSRAQRRDDKLLDSALFALADDGRAVRLVVKNSRIVPISPGSCCTR